MFCHITTKIEGDKHSNLLLEKQGRGWPHFVFMDSEGALLAIHEDEPTVAGFSWTSEKAKAFLVLKDKAAKGDKTAIIDVLVAELEMGEVSADAERRLKDAKPTKEQEAKVAPMIVNASVMRDVMAIKSKDQEKALAKKFYDRLKEGKPGPTSEEAMQPYYVLALGHAEDQKDVEMFKAALNALKDRFGKVEEAQRFFEEKEKKLAELKK